MPYHLGLGDSPREAIPKTGWFFYWNGQLGQKILGNP